jgi:hypothetical protein
VILNITSDGEVRGVHTELLDLDMLGQLDIQRASTVEWTGGAWWAQIIGGPLLGPFQKRSEAIQAEVAWLEANALSGA